MPRLNNHPGSLTALWGQFRLCFTARGYDTFITLVIGLIAAPARRTVVRDAHRVRGQRHLAPQPRAPVILLDPLERRSCRTCRAGPLILG